MVWCYSYSMNSFIKKLVFLFGAFLLTLSYSSAECLSFTQTLSRRQENTNVLLLQKFLVEQGFLKVEPNGYFGAGTFAAVQAYQRSEGFSPVGSVGPATRARIKEKTCLVAKPVTGTSVSIPSIVVATTTATSTKTSSATLPPVSNATSSNATGTSKIVQQNYSSYTTLEERNNARREGMEALLKTIYLQFSNNQGVMPAEIPLFTGKELCLDTASSTCVASPYLPPNMITVPHDPSVPQTGSLLGYKVSKDYANVVTLSSKYTEGGMTLLVRCSFNEFCASITNISGTALKPTISSLNRSILVRDVKESKPFVISGKGFTANTIVILYSITLGKQFMLGEYNSPDGTTLTIDTTAFNELLSCGQGCSSRLGYGEYALLVRTEGGESNSAYFTLKGYDFSLQEAQTTPYTGSFKEKKLATIAWQTSVPLNLKDISLTNKGSNTFITNFILRDKVTLVDRPLIDTFFTISGEKVNPNQLKTYELYGDIDTRTLSSTSSLSYSVSLRAVDTFQGTTLETLPKDLTIKLAP